MRCSLNLHSVSGYFKLYIVTCIFLNQLILLLIKHSELGFAIIRCGVRTQPCLPCKCRIWNRLVCSWRLVRRHDRQRVFVQVSTSFFISYVYDVAVLYSIYLRRLVAVTCSCLTLSERLGWHARCGALRLLLARATWL